MHERNNWDPEDALAERELNPHEEQTQGRDKKSFLLF